MPRIRHETQPGGGNRVRTGDPELAKLVLYQLSYTPSNRFMPVVASLENIPVLYRVPANSDRQTNEIMLTFEQEMV